MSRNGQRRPPRPRIEVRQIATPDEAAAIAAAIERFLRDTAPAPEAPRRRTEGWARAGLLENADENADLHPAGAWPWGDSHPWGR